jgi:hypothetical protein
VTFRRIGDNDLTAIANCHEFAAAESRYPADPNTVGPVDISPASVVAKAASGSADASPVLLHGYYFRVLPKQGAGGQRAGRFALVA